MNKLRMLRTMAYGELRKYNPNYTEIIATGERYNGILDAVTVVSGGGRDWEHSNMLNTLGEVWRVEDADKVYFEISAENLSSEPMKFAEVKQYAAHIQDALDYMGYPYVRVVPMQWYAAPSELWDTMRTALDEAMEYANEASIRVGISK